METKSYLVFWVTYTGCKQPTQWNTKHDAIRHAWELSKRGAQNIQIGNNFNNATGTL